MEQGNEQKHPKKFLYTISSSSDINFEFVPCDVKTEVIDECAYDNNVESGSTSEKNISCNANMESANTHLVDYTMLKSEEGCYDMKEVKHEDIPDIGNKDDNSLELANTELCSNILETQLSVCNNENDSDGDETPKIFQCQRCKINIGNEDFFKKHVLHCGR